MIIHVRSHHWRNDGLDLLQVLWRGLAGEGIQWNRLVLGLIVELLLDVLWLAILHVIMLCMLCMVVMVLTNLILILWQLIMMNLTILILPLLTCISIIVLILDVNFLGWHRPNVVIALLDRHQINVPIRLDVFDERRRSLWSFQRQEWRWCFHADDLSLSINIWGQFRADHGWFTDDDVRVGCDDFTR